VYDVSGAGDTVISMLTLAHVCGASLVESSILANFAAGVEVGKQGTATVTLQELETHMRRFGALV
ncbi:MAG: D-glycero-beta-D-manno-heptose-7-phosphate kinase, partial [Bdellovibrionota bacterium]